MSYADQLLKDMQAGKKVNPMMALREYGCFRLADAAYRLRKRGIDVITTSKTVNGKTFGEYSL